MSRKQLLKKIAKLEFLNDQMETELSYIDSLMHQMGFSKGLNTVKAAAVEILQRGCFEMGELD